MLNFPCSSFCNNQPRTSIPWLPCNLQIIATRYPQQTDQQTTSEGSGVTAKDKTKYVSNDSPILHPQRWSGTARDTADKPKLCVYQYHGNRMTFCMTKAYFFPSHILTQLQLNFISRYVQLGNR